MKSQDIYRRKLSDYAHLTLERVEFLQNLDEQITKYNLGQGTSPEMTEEDEADLYLYNVIKTEAELEEFFASEKGARFLAAKPGSKTF